MQQGPELGLPQVPLLVPRKASTPALVPQQAQSLARPQVQLLLHWHWLLVWVIESEIDLPVMVVPQLGFQQVLQLVLTLELILGLLLVLLLQSWAVVKVVLWEGAGMPNRCHTPPGSHPRTRQIHCRSD